MSDQRELPRYRCHKTVHALKIIGVDFTDEGATLYPPDSSGFAPIKVSNDWVDKHPITENGYYVVYDDGYTSFSPEEAFEAGYRLISA